MGPLLEEVLPDEQEAMVMRFSSPYDAAWIRSSSCREELYHLDGRILSFSAPTWQWKIHHSKDVSPIEHEDLPLPC